MDSFEAISYGPEMASLLASGRGQILAILSNALYLESCEGYVAAVVAKDAVDGPLSLRVRDLPRFLDAIRQQPEFAFHSTRDAIVFDGQVHISLQHARPWTPLLPDRLAEQTLRYEAAHILATTIADHSATHTHRGSDSPGLADLVRPCHSSLRSESRVSHTLVGLAPKRTESLAAGFFAALRMTRAIERSEDEYNALNDAFARRIAEGMLHFEEALVVGEYATAAGALSSLIGLGPGLTPSGDDLVSGIVAALAWQAQLSAVEAEGIEEMRGAIQQAAERTNRISARLLHHACEGVLYAPAMELGAALLSGDAGGVPGPAQRLFGIGHTSGLDLATGLLVGCLATLPA